VAGSAEVISHWHHSVPDFGTSALEFYRAVEDTLVSKEAPTSVDRIDWHESGVLSAKREYLRVCYGRYAFEICAAPFGKDYFFSWWLTKRNPTFAPESQPSRDRALYPSMQELRTAFGEVYRDLAAIAPGLSAEVLAADNPLAYSRARFPTFGEFLTYIMTGHLGYHLGQLSGWRAAAGMALRPGATSPV
jgi:hypothetical protein